MTISMYQLYQYLLGFGLLITGFLLAFLAQTEYYKILGIIGCFIGLFLLLIDDNERV